MMKVVNQKAKWDYELGERLEVGVVLTGAEAKAVRAGQVDVSNAHVKLQSLNSRQPKKELWVINMHVYPYKFADEKNLTPTRTRKLLVSKKELVVLESKMRSGRMTLVPTAVYTRGPLVKMEIALARGKKVFEKREAIKKRDLERES